MHNGYLKKSDIEKQNGKKPMTEFESELIELIPLFQKELFGDDNKESAELTLFDMKIMLKYESKRFLDIFNGKHEISDSAVVLRKLVVDTNNALEDEMEMDSTPARIAESSTNFFS